MHQYEVFKELGSGSFGRVIQVRKKGDNQFLAMKTVKLMQLNAKERDNALNQIRLLASISAPNVIAYKGAFFQESGSVLSIVMQFAEGGDLSSLIEKKTNRGEKFEENFIWKVAFDILRGLKFLHSNNIIHRDIKSANVFFAKGVAKLGDLNVSKHIKSKFATTQTGTPYYTAPEIWGGKLYTATCDVWSLGCLLYELCSLRPPFLAKDFPGLSKKVTSGYYDPIPSRYSKKLATLIRKCLTVDHMRRPSASELLQNEVFLMMDDTEEGQIDLLDTIRCPKILRLLNKQLPQEKKPKTLKLITDENSSILENQSSIRPGSLHKIRSQKNIRVNSIERSGRGLAKEVPRPYLQIHRNKAYQAVMNGPGGYVKLPKVGSYKNLH